MHVKTIIIGLDSLGKIVCHPDVTGTGRHQMTASEPERVPGTCSRPRIGGVNVMGPLHCAVPDLRVPGCTFDGMEGLDRITIEPGKMGGQP